MTTTRGPILPFLGQTNVTGIIGARSNLVGIIGAASGAGIGMYRVFGCAGDVGAMLPWPEPARLRRRIRYSLTFLVELLAGLKMPSQFSCNELWMLASPVLLPTAIPARQDCSLRHPSQWQRRDGGIVRQECNDAVLWHHWICEHR